MTKIFNRRSNADFRKVLKGQMTKSEAVLWRFIQRDALGYRFRRQYGIGNFIVDFYCPTLKLAIEVDGFTHAEEVVFEKDHRKDMFLNKLGIKVNRYSSEQVLKKLHDVLLDIGLTCTALASATPPRPLLEKRGIMASRPV